MKGVTVQGRGGIRAGRRQEGWRPVAIGHVKSYSPVPMNPTFLLEHMPSKMVAYVQGDP